MSQKQRLELTWIGNELKPKLASRILLKASENSYHAAYCVPVSGSNLPTTAVEVYFSGN